MRLPTECSSASWEVNADFLLLMPTHTSFIIFWSPSSHSFVMCVKKIRELMLEQL